MNDQAPTSPPKNSLTELIFVQVPMKIIGTLILVGIVINFSNVISRYVFGNALFWAEEVLVFIVIWSVFVGAIAVTYNGAHLKMDLVSARIGQPWKIVINGIITVAMLLTSIFVITQSFQVVSLMGRLGQVSVAAEVPMIIPHSALLLGFVLIIAAVIVRIRSFLSGDFDGGAS